MLDTFSSKRFFVCVFLHYKHVAVKYTYASILFWMLWSFYLHHFHQNSTHFFYIFISVWGFLCFVHAWNQWEEWRSPTWSPPPTLIICRGPARPNPTKVSSSLGVWKKEKPSAIQSACRPDAKKKTLCVFSSSPIREPPKSNYMFHPRDNHLDSDHVISRGGGGAARRAQYGPGQIRISWNYTGVSLKWSCSTSTHSSSLVLKLCTCY